MLYVIGPPGAVPLVKIGISARPHHRLAELAGTYSKMATIVPPEVDRQALVVLYQQEGGRVLERVLHRHFRGRRRCGEWFDLGSSAVRLVREAIAELYQQGKTDVHLATELRRPTKLPVRDRRRIVVGERAAQLAEESLHWLIYESERSATASRPARKAQRAKPVELGKITTTVPAANRQALLDLLHVNPPR